MQPNPSIVENPKEDSDILEGQRRSFASISETIQLVSIFEYPTVGGIVTLFTFINVELHRQRGLVDDPMQAFLVSLISLLPMD